MILNDKDNSDKQENSNIENDYKELDNEIEKVIRGETSFDEEKNNNNINDNSQISSQEQNSIDFAHNENSISLNQNRTNKIQNTNQKNNIPNNNYNNLGLDGNILNKLDIIQRNNQVNSQSHLNNKISSFTNINKDSFNNVNIHYSNNFSNRFTNTGDMNINNQNNNSNCTTPVYNNNLFNERYSNINSPMFKMYPNNNYCGFSPNITLNLNYYHKNNGLNGYIDTKNFNSSKDYSINNSNLDTEKEMFNCNPNFTPSLSSTNNHLIKKYNFFPPNQQNDKNHSMYKYNEIINNNYIHNYTNNKFPITNNFYIPLLPSKINQNFFVINPFNNLNISKLNNFNNNNSNGANCNLNYYYQYNNDGNTYSNSLNEFNNINLNNSQIKANDEMMLNKIMNKREKHKKNKRNKKFLDLNNNNNIDNKSDIISSNKKNSNSNKTINSYNPEKNGYANKRKIFNPIPDSQKEKNIINLIDILTCKDSRSTLMIKNIPNKYTISSFLEEINGSFKDTYDLFYLPIDYVNKCNLGFAFINFVESFHIILFYEVYRGKKWKKFNSDKKCELLYAKYQGKNELISHFEKGKVLSFNSEDKRPLILPTPNPLPKINLPLKYLTLFKELYPYISFDIKESKNKKSNNNISDEDTFCIDGNFKIN